MCAPTVGGRGRTWYEKMMDTISVARNVRRRGERLCCQASAESKGKVVESEQRILCASLNIKIYILGCSEEADESRHMAEQSPRWALLETCIQQAAHQCCELSVGTRFEGRAACSA